MSYSVKIYDKTKNQLVDAEIEEIFKGGRFYRVVVMVVEEGTKQKEIGRMIYFFDDQALNIQMLWNNASDRFKRVGTSFVEYAFHVSQKSNKNGGIILQPLLNSKEFWSSFGFKFKTGSKVEMHLSQKKVAEKLKQLLESKEKNSNDE